MAAGSYVFTGTGVEDISVSDDISNSTVGTDPEVPGTWMQNLQSFTFDGTMTLEAIGTSSAMAVGVFADAIDTISVGGIISAFAYAELPTAVGIFAYDSGTVLNSAQIMAYSNGIEAYATGIDTLFSGDLYNAGAITSMAIGAEYADARGIQAGGSSGSIVNSGSLDVLASSFAAGIYADTLAGSIDNSADITATSGYQSVGIIASNSGTVFNSAHITAYSEGIETYASGIYALFSGDLYNTGAISSMAIGTEYADARGIQVGGSSGNIVNSGSLDVFATSFATGIYADTLAGNIDNSADITVISENLAAGIYAIDTGTVSNSASIFASGANAFGIFASGSSDAVQSVVNQGSMNINAFGGAGIAIDSGCWDVSSPGFIYTSGNVRTLAVGSYDHLWTGAEPISPAYAHAMLVDDFRIIFDGDPNLEPEVEGAYVPQILVGNDGYLDLNGQTLIAQAGKNIAWNTPYQVIETYNIYESELIANEFGDLVSPNPNINVSWVNSAEKGADAEVIFSYDPQVSMPAVGMRLANLGATYVSDLNQQRAFSGLLAQHIKKQQDILLADSGAIASDAGFLVTRSGDNLENAMFIRPYAKDIDRSTSGGIGYDGNLYGVVLGYERSLSPELTMGTHAGIGLGTIDFKGDGYAENGEDQTIYSLGLHTAYSPDAWLFDGSATFYVAEHEYDGKTGNFLEIDENDDYTSSGAEMEAIVGNVIPFGNMAAMPYAGLGYSWINADNHSTDADDASWNTTYGSVDEHIARSILGTQLSSDLMWGEVKVVPTLGVRWAYALTDNNIKVKQSTLGSPNVAVEDDIDRSSIIGEASLGFSKGALNCELGGTTEYNDDYNTYGGWLALRTAF